MSFRSYAISKGILKIEDEYKLSKLKVYTNEFICMHCDSIYELHERLKGCSIPVKNLLGKIIEDFNFSKSMIEHDVYMYKNNYKNDFEKNVSIYGEEILDRINNIMECISSCDYENMALRSYRNKEICVSNVLLSEIYTNSSSKIYVKNYEDFCENILEYDYIKLFTRLKRTGKDIDFMKCCSYVCSKERFDMNSYNFILAAISYPYEFAKTLSRYRDSGAHYSNIMDNCNFDLIRIKDGETFI